MHGFLPSNTKGHPDTKLSILPFISFLLSLFSAALGLTKFLLNGPISFLPKDSPLSGMISLPFLATCLLNFMFGFRIFAIEHALFTSYHLVLPPYSYDQGDNTHWIRYAEGRYNNEIDAIIPSEYRLVVFLFPPLVSITLQAIKLRIESNDHKKFFLCYPQYIIMPGFSPIMFERTNSKSSSKRIELRIWKLGTILNGLFIGVVPQLILIFSDILRGVTDWNFIESDFEKTIVQNSDAIFKHRYGNITFSISSTMIFLTIFIVLLKTDKLFANKGLFCRICDVLCFPCPKPCIHITPKSADNITPLTFENSQSPNSKNNTINMKIQSHKTTTSILKESRYCNDKDICCQESMAQAPNDVYFYNMKSNQRITFIGKENPR